MTDTTVKSIIKTWWTVLFFAVAIVCFWFGYKVDTIFMAFGAGIFSIGIVITSFLFIQTKILKRVNDYHQIITDKNWVYVTYLFVLAFLIVAAYASAFLVFITLKDTPVVISP